MSRRSHIASWLSDMELLAWVQEARTRPEFQRRLTVWVTYLERWPARRVARTVGVSKQAVWKWVSEYNRQGPVGLERRGRGGRRWGFLPLAKEQALLARAQEEAGKGRVLTAKHLLPRIEQAVGHVVSLDYVYALLKRQGWRKIAPRPTHVRSDPQVREAFKKKHRRSLQKP